MESNWQLSQTQIKSLLWWQEVAQKLTDKQAKDSDKDAANTASQPATLDPQGRAWFIHPLTLITLFTRKKRLWHEPLKNPQRTLYNSNRDKKSYNGAFGFVRNDGNKSHAGLDLFARIGTPCFACLDGEIVKNGSEGSYGNVVVLKVKGDDLRASRNDYILEFSGKKQNEIEQSDDFDINSDYFYIRYCHLHKTMKVDGISIGCKVKAGDHIGFTSDTGNAKGLPNTHLHLEIAMYMHNNRSKNEKNHEKAKLGFKINPAMFVNLTVIDENDQTAAIKGK